jgi:hypothetical protein
LKTKALLGLMVVAALAVFGVVGLQQTTKTEAGNIVGINGCNGTTVAVGTTCDFAVTLQDDISTSGVVATASSGILTSLSVAPSCLVAPTGNGTGVLTLADAGCDTDAADLPVNLNAQAESGQYVWSIRYTCTAASAAGVPHTIALTAPAGVSGAGGFAGSVSPGVATLPGGGFGIQITCVTALPGGNSTLTIRKVDQFGQPLAAAFSIQQGPFWVEVARVTSARRSRRTPAPPTAPRARSTSRVLVVPVVRSA